MSAKPDLFDALFGKERQERGDDLVAIVAGAAGPGAAVLRAGRRRRFAGGFAGHTGNS